MIESFLFAGLGFLVALGLAMLIAPTLWRRAERLERKRIEASLPLSRPEQEAAIDAVRAESAMSIRRLEIKLKALGQKNTQILVESDALHQRLHALHDNPDSMDQFAEMTRQLADLKNEAQKQSRLNDELNMTISTQKIDLVAREAEIERLNNGFALPRTQHHEADQLVGEQPETVEDSALVTQLKQRIANLTSTYGKRVRSASAAEKKQQELREEITEIAAQMVLMVADNEGQNSAIHKALSEPVRTVPGLQAISQTPSLADRVQDLRDVRG